MQKFSIYMMLLKIKNMLDSQIRFGTLIATFY